MSSEEQTDWVTVLSWICQTKKVSSMVDLHYDIIEVHEIKAAFESDPKDTRQMLKYWATDPQYQKTKNTSGN